MRLSGPTILSLSGALALSSAALAQDTVGGEVPALNSQLFRPSIDAENTLWTDDSVVDSSALGSARGHRSLD